MNPIRIKIIYPASQGLEEHGMDTVSELTGDGLTCTEDILENDGPWDFHSASLDRRLEMLTNSLTDPNTDIVLAGRGGYGVSDLLAGLPWHDLKNSPPKLIVGFSDISALHSAVYSKLNWQSIHGPMPNTPYWKGISAPDIKGLLAFLKGSDSPAISLTGLSTNDSIKGKLFGGCLSVLTNLIGTPYFPNIKDHILFFEDIGEHPGKILRNLNQWTQSGVIEGTKGIILGDFAGLQSFGYDKVELGKEVQRRTGVPVFNTDLFGHCSPNYPLMVGGYAEINDLELTWRRSA